MAQVSPYVRSRLSEVLPSEAAVEALSRLETTSFPLAGPGSELESRICLGILKVVCDSWDSIWVEPSSIEKFDDALELAKLDWRDLLVSAGLADADWPEVLRRAGYEVPEIR